MGGDDGKYMRPVQGAAAVAPARVAFVSPIVASHPIVLSFWNRHGDFVIESTRRLRSCPSRASSEPWSFLAGQAVFALLSGLTDKAPVPTNKTIV